MKTFYKKNWLFNLSLLAMLFGGVLFSSSAYAQLSGSYTIDAGTATGGTNFASFADLVDTLNAGGVSGAVTVEVKAGSGPYNEGVTFKAVTGASATNTITINGNGETITFDTDGGDRTVVQFDGADYITLNDLTLEATGTSYARCVHFWKGADYNTVKNCNLVNKSYTGTSNRTGYVVFSNSETSGRSSGNHGRYNTVDNCDMYSTNSSGRMYYGVIDYRSSSYYGSAINNTFTNNSIKHTYYYGMYMYYNNGFHANGNTINEVRASSYYYGIYAYRLRSSDRKNEFNNNIIEDVTQPRYMYGVYAYYASDFDAQGNILRNNLLTGSGYFYGFYNRYSNRLRWNGNDIHGNGGYYGGYGMYNYNRNYSNCEFEENKIHENTTNSSYQYGYWYGMYHFYIESSTVKNNLFYDNGGSYGNYSMLVYYPTSTDVAHNTIYYNNNTNFGYAMFVYDYNGSPYGSGTNVVNNHVYVRNGGTVYMFYSASTQAWDMFDYNNFYVDANFNGGISAYYDGSFYNSLAAFLTAMDKDNTYSLDPNFVDPSAGNFKPQSIALSNKGATGFETEDIDGVTRTACGPDLGAYEYKVDLELVSYEFTGSNECGGYTDDLTVVIKNNATEALSDLDIAYNINGMNEVVEVISGPVAAGANDTFTFANAPVFNKPGANTLNVYLKCDDDASNNELSHNINITPSPYGADMFAGTTFEGYYRSGAGGGSMQVPDVTTNGYKVTYEITPPAAYNIGGYGTDWTLTSTAQTTNGASVTNGITFTAPSGSTNAMVEFDPDSSLAGETVYLSYQINDLNTGCDSIIGRYIYIPHVPEADWTVEDVCDGDVAQFENKTKIGGTAIANYNWKMNDAGADEDEYELINPIHQFSDFGVFTVDMETWNSEYPKFVYKKSGTITVTPVPTIDFKVLNACEGQDIQFNNNTTLPIAGTITYVWDLGDGNTTTTEDPTHQYAGAGQYRVKLVATANGCSSELEKFANQFAVPSADFDVAGNCDNEEIEFTNNTTIAIGNTGYNWDFNDGNISNFVNPTHVFGTPGDKTVKLTAVSEFGCTNEVSKTFTLAEAPRADFDFTTPCNLTATEFTATGTEPGGSVTTVLNWDINGETTSSDATTSYLFSQVGPKQITLTKTSTNGCSDMITKEINVLLQPDADFEVNDVCEGEPVVFKNTSTVAAGEINYQWTFGTGQTSTETSPSIVLDLIDGKTSTFNIQLEASVEGGCASVAKKSVTVNAAPDATFNVDRDGRFITLTPSATGESNYQWRFGDGSRSTMEAPVYEYENVDEGKYTVCLAVQNAAGCWAEDCQEVSISLTDIEGLNKDDNMISVYPNPTSANFNVSVQNVQDNVKLVVVDLLGNVVYENNNADMSGTYTVTTDGLASGVYILQVVNGESYATRKVTINR